MKAVTASSATKQSRSVALLLMLLAGCAPTRETAHISCLLPGQQPMVVAELFFGRGIPDRPPLSEAEWADFASTVISPQFPDGFTVTDGSGQWRNPRTAAISRQGTKILTVAAEPRADLGARLSAVIGAYRARYKQQSVGLITSHACGSF